MKLEENNIPNIEPIHSHRLAGPSGGNQCSSSSVGVPSMAFRGMQYGRWGPHQRLLLFS